MILLFEGTGHVYRCNLARELKSRGACIFFVCRPQPGDLIELLNEEFSVLILPKIQSSIEDSCNLVGKVIDNDYSHWLGCPQRTDANHTFEAIIQSGLSAVDWLIVDNYALDVQWESEVLDNISAVFDQVPSIMIIDDLANRTHLADILLDQNFLVLQLLAVIKT